MFNRIFTSFAPIATLTLFSVSEISASFVEAAPSRPWQRGFQTPATPIAEGIFTFHDDLRIFLTLIFIFVAYIRAVCTRQWGFDAAKPTNDTSVRLVHAPVLEVIWTVLPALILLVIAIPSFSLLYSIDEVVEPLFTVKVIGHQWYWSYEFLDPEVIAALYNTSLAGLNVPAFETTGAGSFDSYRLGAEELAAGEGQTAFRLLTVDNHLFLPTERPIRVRVTSADVLHSWCIPSLGVKLDACPGRLNQTSLFLQREGIYYGQCSEICGVNHGFRPIGIVSQEFFAGLPASSLDVEPLLAALQARARA